MMESISRRDFLRWSAASAGAAAWSLPGLASAGGGRATRCLVVNLVGGPSQHETWDPKPDAVSDVRGPFKSMQTVVPGLEISELFPRLASRARDFALVRSVHHEDAPIHETGFQLLQTGRVARGEPEAPAWFAWMSRLTGERAAILPGPIESTGVPLGHGQSSDALVVPSRRVLDPERYGPHEFGRLLCEARQRLEEGVRFITVNLFTALYDRVTWDCHADGFCLNSTLEDYRASLAPAFDQALAGLLGDLRESGLLESTLVVAQGEFGRTPHLNDRGGRDHWPGVWSILLAGGGVQGGQVIGSSDSFGGEPKDRPVHAGAVFATILHAFGVDHSPLTSHRPVTELF